MPGVGMSKRAVADLLETVGCLIETDQSRHGRLEYHLDDDSKQLHVVAIYHDETAKEQATLIGVDPTQVRMLAVLEDVADERLRQDAKWGQQNYKGGNGLASHASLADVYKTLNDLPSIQKTWKDVLLEEVHEALGAKNDEDLRTELVQVSALAAAWVQALDRKNGDKVS